jgi:membrane-bound metal-dependent hydrolase YbcI (DUF457 family)
MPLLPIPRHRKSANCVCSGYLYDHGMNTQTHVIMSAALFGGDVPKRAWAAALGGVLPDVPMLLIVLVLKLSGMSGQRIFDEMYWQNWWQVSNGIAHNFWAWGGLLLLAVFMRERLAAAAPNMDFWALVLVFAASGLLHSLIDFLCHREDAHMSLWPVTRWKFMSPVSYYDPAHYGRWFSLFEAALGLVLSIVLLQRFNANLLRAVLAICIFLYVAVPAYFIFMFR